MKPIISASAVLSIASLCGCGVIECIDAQSPRPSTPLAGSHTVQIEYKSQPPITINITCEKYYDAMCSERGNYWSVREIGDKRPHVGKVITIDDPNLGKIEFFRPSCELFTKPAPKNFYNVIWVNDTSYLYSGESTEGHVFTRRRTRSKAERSVTIPFIFRVNGKTLLPPPPPQS